MKTLSALAVTLLIGLFSASQAEAAPQFGARDRNNNNRDRVCLYEHIHFSGWEQCYALDDEVTTLDSRKGRASSIRVFGRARVEVFDQTNFRGHVAQFSDNVPDLGLRSVGGTKSWNDRIESLRVVSDFSARNDRDNRNNSPIFGRPDNNNDGNRRFNDGVCVYDRRNYEGREECWAAGTDLRDLGRSGGWSDRISSIRIFGRAAVVLYRDINYNGESIVIDRDVQDLSRMSAQAFRNWDRQASSLAVETDRNNFPGRGRGRGRF